MSITTDAIAAEVALLEHLVDTPAAALWGRDLACVFDITETLGEVPEDDEQAIVESCARRLLTERGTLPDDPDYGYNLSGLLHAGMTTAEQARVETSAKGECLKDDRVAAVDTEFRLEGVNLSLTITIQPLDPELYPPSFTFTVDTTTNILELIA